MDANTARVAREWAKGGLCDTQIAAKLRTNYRALILASMEPGGLSTITGATKNGVNMITQVGLNKMDGLSAMGRAIEWIDLGYVPCQSRSRARF